MHRSGTLSTLVRPFRDRIGNRGRSLIRSLSDWLTACSTHVARAPEDKFSLPDYVVGDVSQIGYLDAESGADEWTSSAPVPAAPTDHDLSSPRAKRPRTDDSGSDHDYSDFERELEAALGT